MLFMDWVVSVSMAAAVMWMFNNRGRFGAVALAVGSAAMAALALVVGGLVFFSLRAFGAVVGMVAACIVFDVGKAICARLSR